MNTLLDNRARRRLVPRLLAIASLAALAAAPAMAADISDKVDIHGYGHTSYFRTDGSGNWDDSLVSLLFVTEVNDRTHVWVQLHNTAQVSHLDWAYVDYRASAQLTARAGQIKLPFGLYNEVIDARFLQQSTLPPLLYQDGAGFAYENMRGFNLSWTQPAGAGSVVLTGYAGEVAPSPDSVPTTVNGSLKGLNVTWNTPMEGLRLMLSGFRNGVEEGDTNLAAFGKGTKSVGVLSADFLSDLWDVKGEVGRASFQGQKSTTAYVQVGYAITDAVKPFVRYDRMSTGSVGDSGRQTTFSLGLSYKVNDNVALRLEDHRSNGYALAYNNWLASSPGAALNPDKAPTNTRSNALGASICFIF